MRIAPGPPLILFWKTINQKNRLPNEDRVPEVRRKELAYW